MEARTFKDLIVEAYKKSKEGNLVGTLYGAISTSSFSDIQDKVKAGERTIYVKLKNKPEEPFMY